MDRELSVLIDSAPYKFLRSQLDLLDRPQVVEVGCGFGRWSAALRGAYSRYSGLDVAQTRIDAARADYGDEDVNFRRIDHSGVWSVEAPVDVVLFITVLQHLPLPTAKMLLASAASALKSDATILLCEGRIIEGDRADAERMYETAAAHMIAKPRRDLESVTPGFEWEHAGHTHYVLRRRDA